MELRNSRTRKADSGNRSLLIDIDEMMTSLSSKGYIAEEAKIVEIVAVVKCARSVTRPMKLLKRQKAPLLRITRPEMATALDKAADLAAGHGEIASKLERQ